MYVSSIFKTSRVFQLILVFLVQTSAQRRAAEKPVTSPKTSDR